MFLSAPCGSFIGVHPRASAEEAGGAESQAKWIAFGRVTVGQGNGVTSATVTADCGMNSLLPTGLATTDSDGRYRLLFGPGIIFTVRGKPWQKQVVDLLLSQSRRQPVQPVFPATEERELNTQRVHSSAARVGERMHSKIPEVQSLQ